MRPHLVDVEVVQGLRRLVQMGEVSSGRADEAIADLSAWISIVIPMSICWTVRGNCETTSAHTTPCTSPSQRRSRQPSSPATRPLAKAPGLGTRIDVID
jgi:hypothetical protein